MSSTIETSNGRVRGLQKLNCYEKPYLAFYAIPYALQPTGEFRFKDARPLKPWTETLDATKVGDASWNFDRVNPFPEEKKIIGSDNCLHLNVYVPKVTESHEKLPVMIYIHGGRFTTMSATPFYYGPDYFMERNVILVTVNYRLSTFGFLSFKDPTLEIPGNAGLRDQLMALKWVKKEIENFGGDPNNITLFGESAGGCMTHYHLLSERSRGLFHRAIIMSGSAFGPWSVGTTDDYAYRLARALGYRGSVDDEKSIYKVILEANPIRIVELQDQLLTEEELTIGKLFAFGPVLEPYVTENTFIYDHPFKMSQDAWGNTLDVIIGGCSMEGLLMYPTITPEAMSSLGDFSAVVSQNVHLDRHSEKCKAKGLKVRNFYYGHETPTIDNIDPYIHILSDKLFWHGMWMTMKARPATSNTYLYRFDVSPSSNQTIRELYEIPHKRGACHVEDIFHIFKAEYLEAPNKDTYEHQVMEWMTGAFAKFAKNGNVKNWTPVTASDVKCINFGKEMSFITFPETDRMLLWDEICENEII